MGEQEGSDDGLPRGGASVSIEGDVATIRLHDECDLATREQISRAFEEARDSAGVILDLSGCTFLDSTVIALLVSGQQEVVARGGRMLVVLPDGSGPVERIVSLMRLHEVFSIHATIEEARTELGA
jgi:anti-sigma B factor antagonist